MAHTTYMPNTGFGLIARMRDAVGTFFATRAQTAEFNRTYSELQGLSDRELNDIGIRRCDIADRVHKHIYCS
ncbi:DUF1127 domain-containing protein [Rhodobacteraceae bacterium M382]|nr:DUF1127 domain-containing protein [Rhodobacteraceae bacterium M382]